MTYHVPPLNALRAFEAAARHLSFKQAAAELNVTPGAVSQQVKSLEDTLGVQLFDRIHNGLMLTSEGQAYLTPIRSAFTNISVATEMISPRADGVDLTIGAEANFAIKWLVPKMAAFQRASPDVRVRIGEASSAEAVVQGEVDIAILKGVSAYGGLRCDLVFQEMMFPLAAPTLAEEGNIDLAGTIILVASDQAVWTTWLERAGAPSLADLERVDLASRDLALHTAMAGRGLFMGSSLEEAAVLSEGRLIRPFADAVGCGSRYYAIYPPGRATCPSEEAFLMWLSSSAGDGQRLDLDLGPAHGVTVDLEKR
ncbi:MAG: LysR substrate-binding domain-containing protein [Geminicoccaceae bacterium]